MRKFMLRYRLDMRGADAQSAFDAIETSLKQHLLEPRRESRYLHLLTLCYITTEGGCKAAKALALISDNQPLYAGPL